MPGDPETLRVTLPSDTGYLHLVSNLTRNAASAAGFTEADAEKVALATDEAVTNVIQHAYHGDSGHTIELRVELSEAGIEIRVIHDGDPIDESRLPEGFDPIRLVRDRRRGGIGVVLMRRLMDRVDFGTTEDQRCECRLRKYRRPPDASP